MEFTEKILEKASIEGSAKVAEAFSKLSGSKVEVNVSQVERMTLAESLDKINIPEEQAVAVYAQLMSGLSGVAILTMSREDSLALVDLLNQQPVGTTGILKDIDRSAIKETLNILSNSYITALAENADIKLRIDVPYMISPVRLKEIISFLLKQDLVEEDSAIIFETTLLITKHQTKASLYLLFSKKLVDLLANSNGKK
jgi:chemotaxis protein CheC